MDWGRIATAAPLVAALVGLVLAMRGEAPRGVHVSGDLAPLIGRGDALSAAAARVEVVALSGWGKLRHVPGAEALCGPPCEAVPGPRVVRVIDLAPRGARKVVLIRLGEGAGTAVPDAEAAACARRRGGGDGGAWGRAAALRGRGGDALAPAAGPRLRDAAGVRAPATAGWSP